jgi:hypothetical protein
LDDQKRYRSPGVGAALAGDIRDLEPFFEPMRAKRHALRRAAFGGREATVPPEDMGAQLYRTGRVQFGELPRFGTAPIAKFDPSD